MANGGKLVVTTLVLMLAITQNGLCRKAKKQIHVATKTTENATAVSNVSVSSHACTSIGVAVSVARTANYESFGRVHYPDVVVTHGEAWSGDESILKVPVTSSYFFHMSAGAFPGQLVNISLHGVPISLHLDRTSTSHNGVDTLGRSFIGTVSAEASVYVDNRQDSELYSQGDRHTSFTTFDIERFMHDQTLRVFSVARSSIYYSVGAVQFPKVVTNVGQAWDNTTHRFTVPYSGIYFFTLSVGVPPELSSRTQIRAKSIEDSPLAELWRSSDFHNGSDVISTSVMAALNDGDSVYVELQDGEIYSDAGHQTSFGGFYYDPAGGVRAAWSVYGEKKRRAIRTALDPFPFDGAWVNTEGMYSFVTNTVQITKSGLYYVALSVGALGEEPLDVYLVRGRHRSEFNIYRSTTNHNGPDTLNQGMMLKLSTGNTLRVVLAAGTGVHSDGDHQTLFSGFLVIPE